MTSTTGLSWGDRVHRHRLSRRPPRSTGFTLVELLIATALLAILLSVVLPNALRMQSESVFAEACELVRHHLAEARTRAIHSGVAVQFRYEPAGRRFVICPAELISSATASSVNTASTSTAHTASYDVLAGELNPQFTFIACCLPTAAEQEALPAEYLEGLPNAQDLALVSWSPPIMFYPDGRGTDAAFELAGPDGQQGAFPNTGVDRRRVLPPH
ncbi:MAG: hypothetical protein KatS3mg113_0078 [Planctomycetaceae bacterium]|nr:MAG: hypothetical protein KatS3mg113_0078 [Planctomycetaceae bacterium]